jgi:hypothetical protein
VNKGFKNGAPKINRREVYFMSGDTSRRGLCRDCIQSMDEGTLKVHKIENFIGFDYEF